jgi:hypothetical protein
MGFLQQDTNNIIVDAVLTDLGRQKLAQGSFNVIKFAAGDDEVDYGMITRYGRTVGQEKIEKNTPVFEAITNNKMALVHPIVSIPDPNRYTLPLGIVNGLDASNQLIITGTSRTVTITVEQTLTGNENVPTDLFDNQFLVVCDDRFIRINANNSTPTIDRNRMASYIISATGRTAYQGATVQINVSSKAITSAQFLIYGQNATKTIIRTPIRVTGMNSGQVVEFVTSISQS